MKNFDKNAFLFLKEFILLTHECRWVARFQTKITLLNVYKSIVIVNFSKQKSKNYGMLLTGSRVRSCQT